jgi:hypothetical protein
MTEASMHRISAGLAACLVAVVTIGCGSVQAAHPGHQGQRSGTPAATPAAGRGQAGCRGAAAAITQADNGKTFCVKVGDTVAVLLHSSDSGRWLAPLASGGALKPVPSGEASLVKGVTGAWFAAVRPPRARAGWSRRIRCPGPIRSGSARRATASASRS